MEDAIETVCLFTVAGVEKVTGKCYEYDDKGNVVGPTEKDVENIRLVASYDTSNNTEKSFCRATPSGEVKFMVTNPKVAGTFKPGAKYLVTLTPIE